MNAEQEQWEEENKDKLVEVDDSYVAPKEPVKETITPTPTPKSSEEVVEEAIEARPLPVKVRTARKKQD